MITLYTFGPAFGLPDPSPFVTKAEVLLKMAGLPYRTETSMTAFRKAPKGKLPYIDDEGVRVADSTFIRWHIEKKHGVDFDAGYDARARATAWARKCWRISFTGPWCSSGGWSTRTSTVVRARSSTQSPRRSGR